MLGYYILTINIKPDDILGHIICDYHRLYFNPKNKKRILDRNRKLFFTIYYYQAI